jgi:uncharacterized membrane protein YtjA (UPF0391 family)
LQLKDNSFLHFANSFLCPELETRNFTQSVGGTNLAKFLGERGLYSEGIFMLGWVLIFFIIALVAGVVGLTGIALAAGLLGFTGVAGAAAGIVKVLLLVFLALFLVSLVMRLVAAKATSQKRDF